MASDGVYFDTDTKLMLHMDDTGLTDSSSSPHTTTLNGDVARSSTQSKFGGYSAVFDGTGDYITVANHSDFDFGSGDFTIDGQMYITSQPGTGAYYSLVTKSDFLGAGVSFLASYYESSGNYYLLFQVSVLGNDFVNKVNDQVTLSINEWHHWAVVRSGNNLYVFLDGTQTATTGDMTGVTIYNSTSPVTIGAAAVTGTNGYNPFSGYQDEVRLVKGTAVWTSNFTPPSAAYIQFGSDAVSGFSNLPLLGVG